MLAEFITIFIALITVINPLAAVPVWLTLTADRDYDDIQHTRRRVAQNVAILLLLFLLVGKFILLFFGLTVTAIRIGGALVIILSALRSLSSQPKSITQQTLEKSRHRDDIGFSPMAMPLLVGPGTMALMFNFTDRVGYLWSSWDSLWMYLLMFVGVLVIARMVDFTLKYSAYLLKLLGNGGIVGLSRIMAFILLSVGVQGLLNALRELGVPIKF